MSNIDVYTFDPSTVTAPVPAYARAWSIGFAMANELVDKGVVRTQEQKAIVLGAYVCRDGLCGGRVCSNMGEGLTRKYNLPIGSEEYYLQGVEDSFEANYSLLGEQNV